MQDANFVVEGERLGMRYIDFFDNQNVFDLLTLDVRIGDTSLSSSEMQLSKTFEQSPYQAQLLLSNIAIVREKSGSIFDLDVWIGAEDFDLFDDGTEKFEAAHKLNKIIFFGLLKPESLSTLSPEYD